MKEFVGFGTIAEESRSEGLEPLRSYDRFTDPEHYRASKALADAVNVARLLGQPLLLTGDPGTGKTGLAHRVAYEYGETLQEFHTKTTSLATDLFYRFDELKRFRDSQGGRQPRDLVEYVRYGPLGLAILYAMTPKEKKAMGGDKVMPKEIVDMEPRRSVVLIDEIDKAPRDLPNDVLNEIPTMSFNVWESEERIGFRADPAYKPLIVMTSNSEKELPEPFLRRCVYFHVESVRDPGTLAQIVRDRVDATSPLAGAAVNHYLGLLRMSDRRPPSIAELISWVHFLSGRVTPEDLDDRNQITEASARCLQASYGLLFKNQSDQAAACERVRKRVR